MRERKKEQDLNRQIVKIIIERSEKIERKTTKNILHIRYYNDLYIHIYTLQYILAPNNINDAI